MSQTITQNKPSRVLMLSMRNLRFHVCRSGIYEFEDVICSSDTVDLIAPTCHPTLLRVGNKLANSAAKIFNNGKLLPSLVNYRLQVDQEYELFFFFCQSIREDIMVLNSIKGWREKCRYAVCWLDEVWLQDIKSFQSQLQLLKDFDFVFMNFSSSIDRVAEIIQRPCDSIPYGVDAVKFCPYPHDIYRCIDVLNIGRRSTVTHNALLEQVEREDFFYIYDTINKLYTSNYNYHRSLYRNLVKRSRYMIVNKAKFDLTGKTNPQEEVGPRFFEGAAGGTIMLGVPPKCQEFTKNFDWSDAAIEIPFDSPNIADIIADLDAQPDRQARIRERNIVNSLLKHDWVYRWEQILATVGLDTTPQILKRKDDLKNLAEKIATSPSNNQKPQLTLVS